MDDVKDYPPYLDYPKPRKAMTNAQRIRAMRDEELAKILGNKCLCPPTSECVNCFDCWLEWLQQPSKEV